MDRPKVTQLLSEVARRHAPGDRDTAAMLHREVLPGVPELTAVPVIARQTQQMVDEHVAAITAALVAAGSPQPVELAAITAPFARDCAHWDVSVGAILRSYQRGHQRLWQLWQQRIETDVADPEARAAVVALCAEVLLEYVTAGMEVTVHTHAVEREARLRGASWRQRDDVLAVLEGRASGSEDELSRRLGHPLQRTHVAFVCWSGVRFTGRDVGGLEAAAREWADAAAGCAPLLVPVDSTTTWGWLSAPAGAGWLDGDLPAPREGFRIATGTPAPGPAGFRSSHTEALRAQTIASAAAVPVGVTRFADVATLAVLTDDVDALRRFVAAQLGDLALPGERAERLRATLRNYCDGGANARAVARELNYHRNTIQQRLELAARLRGRPLDEDRSGLALALAVAEHYGAAVLAGPATPE
ncbi:PucR family transcriptional regulator [Sporichthya polymorpha]|uniref:PucR family transcriptional regulator n=1 Tax=Sporichthya polymorpha TaxID=35751 RepID=UPI00037803FF|nr:helix-turn-helix domain-containing protein [Sporichthya polymorpha]